MNNYRLFADQYEGNREPNLALYAKAGHVLYAHKATEGVLHMDQRHRLRVRSAHMQGLTVMHYHFCRPDQRSARGEMEHFWATVRSTYWRGDILALDFETASRSGGGVVDMDYIEQCWTHLLNVTGHTAVIYGSTSFLSTYVRVRWLRYKRRWQAAYGPEPSNAPWFTRRWAWQRTDGNVGPGPYMLAGIGLGDVSILNRRTATVLLARARWWRWRIKK